MPNIPWALSPDRCFDADPAQRPIARGRYASVKDLPIVSPHGHVPPALLADPATRLGPPWWFFDNATRWLAVALARSFGGKLRVNAIAPG